MLCEIAFAILTSDAAAWYEPRREAMVEVCHELLDHSASHAPEDAPPVDFDALVVAMSWTESRWMDDATGGAGERGAMQVMPQYHCPSTGTCDYEEAGVLAISTALSDSRAYTVREALCRYNTGNFYGDCAYARRVLRVYEQIQTAVAACDETPACRVAALVD